MLKRAYQWRGLLVAPPVLFSAVCFWHEYENELLTWVVGIGVFLAGWALRIWAQQHLRYRLTRQRALTTSGPYALVRNPIYLGNTLVVLGVVVASEVIWMVPFTILWCAGVYTLVTWYEERRLTEKYGEDYLAYKATVPRWVMRLAHSRTDVRQRPAFRPALFAELHVVLVLAPVVVKALILAPFME
ncbi:MAG: isoprenylcysteine carboxylmethyltransferase family protein [Nitrospinae bacterium]|nr:isoprenylcysteine carboxylmethyltransferase family protein [Nitrospinota bacterium]